MMDLSSMGSLEGCGRAPSVPGGVLVFLTGLSAAGKSSLAARLAPRLEKTRGRPTTVLDGDEVRAALSSELGFSRRDRDLNVARIAFVAAQIVRHGGACVVAAIAPYAQERDAAIALARAEGLACLAHVSTSLSVCESRDPKGLYAKARRGEIAGFTGLDDPYETPERPDLNLDLGLLGIDEACGLIEGWIAQRTRQAS